MQPAFPQKGTGVVAVNAVQSMVREAVNDKCHSVACDALLLLHKAVQSGAVTNHSEADILRVAVKHRELADEPLLTSYLAVREYIL
jgi:hypothetical protein